MGGFNIFSNILVYHEGSINGEVTREEILNATVTQEAILAKAFGADVEEDMEDVK